jgi:hypothetical protein
MAQRSRAKKHSLAAKRCGAGVTAIFSMLVFSLIFVLAE